MSQMKINILCPGQGAQAVGMGKDFHEQSPAARAVFDRANSVLGWDLASICFNGPEERLNQTDVSQPAIYVTSIACAAAAGLAPESATALAGLSLGEYTALHLAGVFTFEDGLKLVASRGKYMQQAAIASPSGMVAILGADEPAITDLCARCANGEVLVPANFNAPGQIVVSGAKSACERVLAESEKAGFKATALKVAGAFHSPLMQPAADKMAAELEKVDFKAPRTTVYSNVTGKPHEDVASIKKLLVQQITHAVRWQQNMQSLIDAGEARFIELAPGRTLAGLAKRINRRLPIESITGMDALPSAKVGC
ncbi:MAG TPA: ACP S-malonyltransferase [Tepidisphaeraceae bacterium]|nr:ACP S-malonyltransferase [Tepidisphaeraceae bacterium]